MPPKPTPLTLREGLDLLARKARTETPHPPGALLAAYHRGELPKSDAATVAEHLSVCPPCAQGLLELAEFMDDEDPERSN